MSNLNRITLIGNIGTEVEKVEFDSGHTLYKFSIAVSRWDKKESKDVPDWFDVETFSKLGEYCKKGIKVCVDGSIITNVWKNKDEKYIKNFIVKANTVEILTPKNTEGETQQEATETVPDKGDVFDEYYGDDSQEELIGDEEIPF